LFTALSSLLKFGTYSVCLNKINHTHGHMSTEDASTQLSPSREGGSCSVGREVYPPDPDTTPGRVTDLCVAQHADHDTVADERAPRRTASLSVHRDAAGVQAAPDGELSGVVRLSGAPPWRAGGRSADVRGPSSCYRL